MFKKSKEIKFGLYRRKQSYTKAGTASNNVVMRRLPSLYALLCPFLFLLLFRSCNVVATAWGASRN